jgi:hypothetical protein
VDLDSWPSLDYSRFAASRKDVPAAIRKRHLTETPAGKRTLKAVRPDLERVSSHELVPRGQISKKAVGSATNATALLSKSVLVTL